MIPLSIFFLTSEKAQVQLITWWDVTWFRLRDNRYVELKASKRRDSSWHNYRGNSGSKLVRLEKLDANQAVFKIK